MVVKPIASKALLVGSDRDNVENGCRSFPALLVLASVRGMFGKSSSIIAREREELNGEGVKEVRGRTATSHEETKKSASAFAEHMKS